MASRTQLRALLERDRQSAGETRTEGPRPSIETAPYQPTLSARWQQFLKRNEYRWRALRLARRRLLGAAFFAGVAVVLAVRFTNGSRPSPSRSPQVAVSPVVPSPKIIDVSTVRTSTPAPARAAAAPTPATPAVAAPVKSVNPPIGQSLAARASDDAGADASDPKVARWIEELSPRARVVRADALLRNPHLPPARRARALLENVLAQGKGGAHAQAALAEACLRIGDHACAREAIDAAIELRPWRNGYRSFRRRIVRAERRARVAKP